MTVDEAQKRAYAGFALLDLLYGEAHVRGVNLADLSVANGHHCPLAQASGRFYTDALDVLLEEKGLDLWSGGLAQRRLGFIGGRGIGVSYTDLDNAWIALYLERRKELGIIDPNSDAATDLV